MSIDRRGFLGLIGAGAATASTATAAPVQGTVAFEHGVASGDPSTTAAIFWTRITPADPASGAIPVVLEVARDEAFADVVRRSTGLEATPARDFTVKHDLDGQGLEPGREYFYRFVASGVTSPVGRVKTLPEGATADVAMAVVSCQLYPGGLFNAYDAISKLDRVDAVIHLGDYIYEYGAEADAYGMDVGATLNRAPLPAHEIVTLADYRQRHAQYKTDPDLQAAHARAAFICVWDDHEVANDTWNTGAENHQPDTEGDFATRKAAALKAYFEWMPIREPVPGQMAEAIQRTFHFGDLASLMMVETRLQGRKQQLTYAADITLMTGPDGKPMPDAAAFEAKRNATDRDLLGDAQREWLGRELAASRTSGRPWQVLGNQVVMARVAGPNIAAMVTPEQLSAMLAGMVPEVRTQVQQASALFSLGLPFNLDSWDGYPAGRERLYDTFKAAGVKPIVLAGDSHSFWVNDLKDAGGQRVAVEFGTSSITSPSPQDAIGAFPLGQALTATNPEVLYCDQSGKGYILLTLTPTEAKAELIAVSTIIAKPYEARVSKTYTVTVGAEAGAVEV